MMKQTLAILLAALLAGCAGYHIGPVKPRILGDVKTVAVPMVANKTLVPRIEALVTDAIIKQIQQDGTYEVAPAGRADVVLQGSIKEIRRNSRRSVRQNILATKEFETQIFLEYTLVRRDTGQKVSKGTAVGVTSYFVGGDLQQQEYQALPLAAEDAAVRLTSQISEGW
jgi:hypothetical protein